MQNQAWVNLKEKLQLAAFVWSQFLKKSKNKMNVKIIVHILMLCKN